MGALGRISCFDPGTLNREPRTPCASWQGRYSHRFFTKHKILYDRLSDDDRSLVYIFPKKTNLKHRLGTDDELFIDFVNQLLQVNPAKRSSATKVRPYNPYLTSHPSPLAPRPCIPCPGL